MHHARAKHSGQGISSTTRQHSDTVVAMRNPTGSKNVRNAWDDAPIMGTTKFARKAERLALKDETRALVEEHFTGQILDAEEMAEMFAEWNEFDLAWQQRQEELRMESEDLMEANASDDDAYLYDDWY